MCAFERSEKGMDFNMKKNEVINYLRCIATILVVLIHGSNIFAYFNVDRSNVILNIFFIISNTAVPIFFLISGYLTFLKKEIDYKKYLNKKIKLLVLPYIIWTVIYYIFNKFLVFANLLPSDTLQNINVFNLFVGIPFYSDPVPYGPLWFLRDLILLNLLVPVLDKVYNIANHKIIILVMLILLIIPIPQHLWSALFFVLGGLFARNEKIKTLCKKSVNFTIFIIVCVIMNFVEYKFSNILLDRITILIYIYLVYYIAIKTVNFKPTQIIIAFLTPYSFWIYLTHGKILSILQIIISKLAYENIIIAILGYFILPIITIFICTLVGKVIKKYMPKVFDILIGNRH